MPNALPPGARILVTGARGFVGRAVTRRLLAEGFAVRGTSRVAKAGDIGEVDWVEAGPLFGTEDWGQTLVDVDAIVHLAAMVHVMDATAPEEAFMLANRDVTRALAEAASKAGVKHFVFMSTIKVMGEGRAEPYREGDGFVPFDAYARSKVAAELALSQIALKGTMTVSILRPPLVYGPGVGANFLSLLKLVDRCLPLPLGAAGNKRSLIFVDNLADAVVAMLRRTNAGLRAYLVADAEAVSTPELIRRAARALGRPALLPPVPLGPLRALAGVLGKAGTIERLTGSLWLDAGAITRDTGWVPPFTLDQGLAATAQWYRKKGG